jgi:hypothetical protein
MKDDHKPVEMWTWLVFFIASVGGALFVLVLMLRLLLTFLLNDSIDILLSPFMALVIGTGAIFFASLLVNAFFAYFNFRIEWRKRNS